MGLLSQSTQNKGLLARTQAPAPTPLITENQNSTPTGLPTFKDPVITPTPEYQKPTAIPFSGTSNISQGKVSPVEGLLQKISNNTTRDIIRGVLEAPKTLATEAGLLDEDQTVKLDRIASGLIQKGTDSQRAYEIASNQLAQGKMNPDVYGLKNAKEQEKALNVTKEEKVATTIPKLINAGMTGLAMSNIIPGAGTIEKKVGEGLLKKAEQRVGKQSIEELQGKGLLSKGTSEIDDLLNQKIKTQQKLDILYAENKGGFDANSTKQAMKLKSDIHEIDTYRKELMDKKEITPDVRATDYVTNQVNNGAVKLKANPQGGWKASVGSGEDIKNFSAYKKQDVENQVYNYLNPKESPIPVKKGIVLDPNAPKLPPHLQAIADKYDKNFGTKIETITSDQIFSRTPEETATMRAKTQARREAPVLAKPVKEVRTLEVQNMIDGLKAQKEAIENTGFQSLQKYESKRGEFKGELNTNNGTGEFSKTSAVRLREVFNDIDNKYTTDELKAKYEDLKAEHKSVTDEIKRLESTTKVQIKKEVTNRQDEWNNAFMRSRKMEFKNDTPAQRVDRAAQDAKNGTLYDNAKSGKYGDKKSISSASQKQTQISASVPKQAESTVSKAEEVRSQLHASQKKVVPSLPDIVAQKQTEVKSKVNLLDYIRTPDRVLKKIGFENESKMVRKAYEAYTNELPTNIDKITTWSKEVPKESNEKIFKYLDGQKDIVLNKEEAKVATEIQAWLKEWATRLHLPEEKRVSNYITRIFNDSIIGKEFDEDLAKIIADKIPGEVYNPFLLKRIGAEGYKQDTWAALDAYVKRATRKVHMDPSLDAIQMKAGMQLETSKLEESQWRYINRYVKAVNMRPTELDNLIDNTLKSIFGYKYGTRPVTYLTKLFRRMTFRGMLGFNPGSALRNLSQGINTYAVLGEKYTALGYAKLFNPGARAELDAAGVFSDNFIQDRTLSSTKKMMEKVDKGIFAMFNTAEHINRGAAYFGAKAKGLSKGMTEEKAIEYAKKVVRDTQFNFGSIDTPVALQSDIVKTLTQFQTYTVKQAEFLTEMAKDKNFIGLLRYAGAGLAFTYTIGKAFDMTPDQLIPSFRFDTPPSLKAPVEVAKAALNTPDKYGQPRSLSQKASDVGKSFIGLIPGGSQMKKTIEGAQLLKKGGSFDKGGNLQFEAPQTTKGKAQALLFGKYSGEKARNYFDRADIAKEDMKQVQPIYDQAQKLLADGKEDEAQALVDSLGDKGYEIYKKIRSQDKAEKTKQGKQDILPTYQKARKLLGEGREEEAQAIVDSLTDDEYKYYELVKKQLNP